MYDVIVIGLGGVGSAASYHLAQRGLRVLGLDQFSIGHANGSSHGETRAIRQAYFEHPDYVPLVQRSYTLWDVLAQESQETLYEQTGLVQCGLPSGVVTQGVLRAAAEHDLPIEQLTAREVMTQWPGLHVPEHLVGLREERAGFLHVERCVRAHAECALRAGATFVTDAPVSSWAPDGDGVVVHTKSATYHGQALVVCGGAWSNALLRGLSIPLRVQRQAQFWYDAPGLYYDQSAGFPTFLFETPEGYYYGFPRMSARGMKIAQHGGGVAVADPGRLDRSQYKHERAAVEGFIAEYLPAVGLHQLDHAVCMYTLSQDEHFIVDTHPQCAQVCFAAGLSGHGFKFAPVLGEILADYVVHGRTELPADFLRLRR